MSELCALVVDDSAVMRKIIDRALRQSGLAQMTVVEAANGEEALARLERNRVDLVISDISMPVMDGLTFVLRARESGLPASVPIVMITTESSEQHVRAALENGAQGYIRKPFTPDQVKAHIGPLLPRAVECA